MAGWADWADLPPAQARIGLVHAASNVAAAACHTASLAARLRGRSALGRLWALSRTAAVAVSGALGGHAAYRQAVGAHASASGSF
ncbi:(2Fe-2S)-binding protein, partial [Streptomyces sp. NPDC054945]